MPPHLSCRAPHDVTTNEIAPECAAWLAPLSAYMVKGWTRSVTAQSIMFCAYEMKDEFMAHWPQELQERPDFRAKVVQSSSHEELPDFARNRRR